MVRNQAPEANGATIANGGQGGCYAEFGMTASNGVGSWETCIFFTGEIPKTQDALACAYGFTVNFDGSVGGSYNTDEGTLAECYSSCSDGTWSGCVGFARYIAAAENDHAPCWWVTTVSDFIYDDGNSNEHLYINDQSHGSFVCTDPELPFSFDYDGSVGGSYNTAEGTLAECYAYCTDGTWHDCVGFSRYMSAADDTSAECWWVSDFGQFIFDDENSNENLYIYNPNLGYC